MEMTFRLDNRPPVDRSYDAMRRVRRRIRRLERHLLWVAFLAAVIGVKTMEAAVKYFGWQ